MNHAFQIMLSVCVSSGGIVMFIFLSVLFLGGVLNKIIIPLTLFGYEMIIANLVLHTSIFPPSRIQHMFME